MNTQFIFVRVCWRELKVVNFQCCQFASSYENFQKVRLVKNKRTFSAQVIVLVRYFRYITLEWLPLKEDALLFNFRISERASIQDTKKEPFFPSIWGYFVILTIYIKIQPGFSSKKKLSFGCPNIFIFMYLYFFYVVKFHAMMPQR